MNDHAEITTSESAAAVELLANRSGIPHSRAMLRAAAILGAAAVLIAVGRLGPFDFHDVMKTRQTDFDFDDLLHNAAASIGITLAAVGFLYLIVIWAETHFRVSIGRLMVVVMMLAVSFQVVITLRRWEDARRVSRSSPAIATPRL
jgi:hypothetical protein